MKQLRALIIVMRPYQWAKNIFVFAAAIFSGKLLSHPELEHSIYAFLLFCGASSVVYLLNDAIDAPSDRLDPEKAKRPIASGALSPLFALVVSGIGTVVLIIISSRLDIAFTTVLALYIGLNAVYSLWLKSVVILDVMSIGASFLLRVVAGGVMIHVPISSWLLVCSGLLALFLGFGKRRYELVAGKHEASNRRSVLSAYSLYFLDQMMSVVTASTLVAYILYTVAPETEMKYGTNKLIMTVPFVLYGIFRYLYIIHQEEKGGNPTRIVFTDIPLLINVVLWFISSILIIYVK